MECSILFEIKDITLEISLTDYFKTMFPKIDFLVNIIIQKVKHVNLKKN